MFLSSPHHGLRKARSSARYRLRPRPSLEALEDRCLPSTVTNLADSGPGSLRDAIATTPAGGTVDFQPGLSGTITLTTGELLIDKNLTIAGPGSSVITVSGNNASRVFDIAAAETVAISGLTIADGTSLSGGGIYNAGMLTASGLTISGNSASGVSGEGGGIYNDGGTLTVTSSTLSGNSAISEGGGIYNDGGTLTVTSSTLSGNTAGRVDTGRGGGIWSGFGGMLTVTNSTLSGNGTHNSGGGIYNSGTLIVTSSTLSGNSVRFYGGGIANDGTLTVTSSTFSGNSAIIGGGVGGGIDNDGTLTVTSSTFSGNSAAGGGGIANFGGTLTVTSSTFSGNSVISGGGGVANFGGTLTVTSSTFSGNSAIIGGGVGGGIDNDGTLTVTSSTLSGNSAGSSGGGIFVSPSALATALRNTIVAGNTAPTGPDVNGTLNSRGYNLIGIGDGGSGYADTDLVGTADFPIDPMLQPLGDYGGPTQTMPPLPDSPAINAGDNTDAPATDQRGFPRIVLGFIDIGAVELQPSEFGGPAVALPLAAPASPPASVAPAPSLALANTSRLDALFQLLGNSSLRKHGASLAFLSSLE